MPVLKDATCREPKRICLIGLLGWRLIGSCPDHGTTIRLAVKTDAFTFLDVRIEALPVTPPCFFSLDNRPAQPAPDLRVHIIGGEIFSGPQAEFSILLKERLL